jgi:hypothetical protein
MEIYKTMAPDAIQAKWPSKNGATGEIPMPRRRHVCTAEDEELKELLTSLKPDPPCPFGGIMDAVRDLRDSMGEAKREVQRIIQERLGPPSGSSTIGAEITNKAFSEIEESMGHLPGRAHSGSKLTEEKELRLRRLVDAGASLRGINALHRAAAAYDKRDLFDLLTGTYGMDIEGFDDIGRRPLHVAAVTSNADAVRMLLAMGAEKGGKNVEGQTALEELQEQQRGMDGLASVFLGNAGAGAHREGALAIMQLLR